MPVRPRRSRHGVLALTMERSLALTSGPHLFPCGDSIATLRRVWETHRRRFEHHHPGEEIETVWAYRVFELGVAPATIEAEDHVDLAEHVALVRAEFFG